jgi:hypothetical protein
MYLDREIKNVHIQWKFIVDVGYKFVKRDIDEALMWKYSKS